MKLKVHQLSLPLRDPFRIAHESRTEQPTLIVELSEGEFSGLGETAMTRYYGLDSQRCAAELRTLAPAFARHSLGELKESGVGALLEGTVPVDFNPFLRCALDVALHDLWAKAHGQRLGLLWEQDRTRHVPTCYTIGLAPVEEMVRKLRAFPWPVYKIKLGGGDDDVAIIRALREHTDAPFYVDANTGWTARQAIDFSGPLSELGVVFIEQPLKPADTAGQAEVHRHSVLPVLADESCQTEDDVDRCAEHFSGINIKVVKCGGLLPARRMIARARTLGLQVMAGCMTESSVGISGIAQLLPELDYADLDGAMLLADDPATGVTFDPQTGYAIYPDRPGTGAVLK
ncbi:L-alanine-DL-glutamate epimerase-like enolase superfamily enzyme [Lewinella marina]|uniref:Dipeptide epimerase n=1 Tax=Neolewinella marina TaxID=438751 RepID=A0A2G0CC79_9BACT|nr:dipeptide epimerase [Neolewinella marina]NJB86746.1 L-alanine-DL-glutamate epimerase-like enolase superfamily enzyme [Neolewinella marina]PHK97552.1 dipeptide epimerase [Neolewinella marina]